MKKVSYACIIFISRLKRKNPYDRVGVLLVGPTTREYPIQESLGDNAKEVAQSLFSKLRKLESLDVSVILVQGIREDNEGLAVMNRLRKAATILI